MRSEIHGARIKSVAAVVPVQQRGYEELVTITSEKEARRIIQNTGIEHVRVSGKDKTAADYCELSIKIKRLIVKF